jgi:hypothetical protein
VINKITIAVGLLFMVPAWAVSQESEHSQKNANDFARSVLQNEVKGRNQRSQPLDAQMETEKSCRKEN